VLVGGRSFHEREEIGAVRNVLRAIEWPDDEMSVYATLRGPFFSFTDEDLFAFRHAHRRLHPIVWRDLERPDLPPHPPGSPAELTAIAGALSILGNLHRRRNRRSISDTLGRLLAETRAHAGVAFWPAGEQALANVFRVMDIARRYESAGATSFRAFIERLDDDAERGKQPEAPVVEEGTEGTRIMTVHAAKGLEFPIVILCDPCAPLSSDKPSRYIDSARRVWLEPLAGCVPAELREHEQEVIDRDREEVERLAYVAVTRARDMLVVPVVGDEPLEGLWLDALTDVVYPADNMKRTPRRAPNCPAFGDDSVVERSRFSNRMPYDSVAPGLHAPRLGTHEVVWWDPHALKLAKDLAGGLREQQILEADKDSGRDIESEAHHAAWVTKRRLSLANASVPTLISQKVTLAAKSLPPSLEPRVTIDETPIDRRARPGGLRFGSLVHAALAAVDLRGDAAHVEQITRSQARLLDPPETEVVAAIAAVRAALAHPLLKAAAASRSLRREVPVALDRPTGMIEGIVDLAFETAPGTWIVVDFKTDTELAASQRVYIAQVQLYAMAIAAATNGTATGVLLVV
jgi:ATP-dependent exoDNAse (exonuclease V) beta subunit